MITTIKHQAKELLDELHRVDWPTTDKVLSAAVSVAVVSAFVGAFLAGSDWVISWGMKFLIPHH